MTTEAPTEFVVAGDHENTHDAAHLFPLAAGRLSPRDTIRRNLVLELLRCGYPPMAVSSGPRMCHGYDVLVVTESLSMSIGCRIVPERKPDQGLPASGSNRRLPYTPILCLTDGTYLWIAAIAESGDVIAWLPDIPSAGTPVHICSQQKIPGRPIARMRRWNDALALARHLVACSKTSSSLSQGDGTRSLLSLVACAWYDHAFLDGRVFCPSWPPDPPALEAAVADLVGRVREDSDGQIDLPQHLQGMALVQAAHAIGGSAPELATQDLPGAIYLDQESAQSRARSAQFFTPESVVRMVLDILNPWEAWSPDTPLRVPRIIDPACGSGRFLSACCQALVHRAGACQFPESDPELWPHLVRQDSDTRELVRAATGASLTGIERDAALLPVAAVALYRNNGRATLIRADALCSGEAEDGTFDLVLSNPPFGMAVTDQAILQHYTLACQMQSQEVSGRAPVWLPIPGRFQSSVPTEVLFIERAIRLARPGSGRIALVLPDGILGNPRYTGVRQWILSECQVCASISLPIETFLPATGTKCSVLILRRWSTAEAQQAHAALRGEGSAPEYDVLMALVEAIGWDRRGNPQYRHAPNGTPVIQQTPVPIVCWQDGTWAVRHITYPRHENASDLFAIVRQCRAFFQNEAELFT